jgi:CUG-BP- and ETR3-like factor
VTALPVDPAPEVKLFIGMLPRSFEEEHIRSLFEPFGEIEEVFVLRNHSSGESKGCCFLKYTSKEAGNEAIQELNGQHTCDGATAPLVVKAADTPRQRLRRKSKYLLQNTASYWQVSWRTALC